MANKGQDNLIPFTESSLTKEEVREINRKGGINSGKTRQQKASFKQAIKWLMESDIRITEGDIYDTYKKQGIDISQFTPAQLATIGLWAGATTGKAENYKVLMEGNEERIENTDTPEVNINIIDNSNLEKALYEEDKEE